MKKLLFLLVVALATFSLSSCNRSSQSNGSKGLVEVPLRYAKLFKVFKANGYTQLDVVNPWDTAILLQRFYLVPKQGGILPHKVDGQIIRVPVSSMACASSTDVCYAQQLGLLDSIVGVAEPNYINNSYLLSRLGAGKVVDLGQSMEINREQLIRVNPNIFFVSPFKDNKYAAVMASGIPLAMVSAYMEEHPLGRAEWVKFMALFFGKEERANFYFDSLVSCYQKLARVGQSAKTKPTVFSGKPYQGIWYVSPGNSYMAKLLADAGARYLFAYKHEQGAIPLDFETVYKKAANADFWVMLENYPGQYSYSILKDEYAPYADFDAFKNGRIVFCNTYKSTYYDEGMLQPDRLLADFIKAFHPELLPNYQPAYYSMLKN
ncbi:MAG TPA: ABC transporter substrate-binding protein [Williamwhitmania sp.]|nr:ABC transporter substrate-binding protein [Williamwhitmania sp.]